MTEKKKYDAPQMKVQQMKPESIICTSETTGTKTKGLEYDSDSYEF